jgi:hypothetical protein
MEEPKAILKSAWVIQVCVGQQVIIDGAGPGIRLVILTEHLQALFHRQFV